jgi:hypothetical protein
MKTRDLDTYEKTAIVGGGNDAGAYLDSIGETDLAKLSAEEFGEFFARFLVGFERSMRGNMEAVKDTF